MIDLFNPEYSRLIPNFYVYGYGQDDEPNSTGWMASLIRPMGERFCEGIKILDYGCGCGRLFNFMTGHLKGFHYYGAEPDGGKELAIAKSYFGNDPRATFLTCEDAVKLPEVLTSDAVILGSIFTHLRPETCENILANLWPIIEHGGMIIFTALFRPQTDIQRPGAHGFADCYSIVYQAEGWLQILEQKFGRPIVNFGSYPCSGGVTQFIYRIT